MKGINEELIAESVVETIKHDDIWKLLKNSKDFEKKVREISSDVIIELFRILFQHQGLFKNLAKK